METVSNSMGKSSAMYLTTSWFRIFVINDLQMIESMEIDRSQVRKFDKDGCPAWLVARSG